MNEIEKLNLREYRLCNLKDAIPPECQLLHEYSLDAWQVGKRGLEIGPGSGRATIYLASMGFTLDVVDNNPEVLLVLRKNLKKADIDTARISFNDTGIQEYEIKDKHYSLINASNVLHFLERPAQIECLTRLTSSLVQGGIIIVRVHAKGDTLVEGDYVKHFFVSDDFKWFEENGFSRLYMARIEAKTSRRSAVNRATADKKTADKKDVDEGEIAHFMNGVGASYEAVFQKN